MKHVLEIERNCMIEHCLDIETELSHSYRMDYRKKIKDYDIYELVKELSELEIDAMISSEAALGLTIAKEIMRAVDIVMKGT